MLHLLLLGFVLSSCSKPGNDPLVNLDPGTYDSTWWNRAPIRLIQTNLPEIQAGMDMDEYVQTILEASANTVLLNVGGIVANYPTKLPYHFKNPYAKEDLVGGLLERLHSHGIKVLGRFDFSKVNETIAEDSPGWLYVGTDGKIVNYNGQVHTCINGAYQQEYSFEILKEAITSYPLDGIFFNMIGYTTTDYDGTYHGICQCNNCKKRFLDSTGFKLPINPDMGDPVYRAYRAFQRSTSNELFGRIRDHIKSLNPKIIINTYTDAGVDLITTESSTSLSDRYDWNYFATGNLKPTLGSYKDITPSNLIMYFQAIGYRHIGPPPNLAKAWFLENMLHGAPATYVVIGTMPNHEDRLFFPVLKELMGFHKKNEKLFTNVASACNVALIRGAYTEYQGLIKLLTEEHIMYDVLEPSAIGSPRTPRSLEDYEVVIIGDLSNMDDRQARVIDEYVNNGGKLLTTGITSMNDALGGRRNELGIKSLGVTGGYEILLQEESTYLKVSKEDKQVIGGEEFRDFDLMMMFSRFIKCNAGENAHGYFRLVPHTMFGPPEKCYYTDENVTDVPGLIVNTYGKGKSVFIPWQLGSQYNFKGNYAHRVLFTASLRNLLNFERLIETDASPLIEMTHMVNRNGAYEWIGMINHSGQLGSSFRDPVPIFNTRVRFKPAKPVKQINLMRTGKQITFTQEDGWVEGIVPEIRDFEMVLCTY